MRAIIIGAGSQGLHTARLLVERNWEVVVVEKDEDLARRTSEMVDCGVIHGDGTRPAVLEEAGAERSDVLLALTTNPQTNLIASLVGRLAGVSRVLTRIDDEEFEHVAIALGLSDTVIPARTIGRFLADMVQGQDVLELSGAIRGEARIFQFIALPEDEGPVSDLGLPSDAKVSHLYRDGRLLMTKDDTALREGDEVVIVCHDKHLEDLRERWKPGGNGDGS